MGSKVYNAYKHENSSPITSWASLGAKNYSYNTEKNERIVKCRGFDLSSNSAKEKINHEQMLEMLSAFISGKEITIECENFRMAIDRKSAEIRNSTIKKKYTNNVYDKRIIMKLGGHPDRQFKNSTICTLPFGLKNFNFNDCEQNNVFS